MTQLNLLASLIMLRKLDIDALKKDNALMTTVKVVARRLGTLWRIDSTWHVAGSYHVPMMVAVEEQEINVLLH
jgi:hypothetical protein